MTTTRTRPVVPRRAHRPAPLVGLRLALGALTAGAAVLLAAAPASAHVLIESVEPNGDGTSTLIFTFEHGCDGSPTDTLTVTLPDGIQALNTGQPSGWASDLTPRAVHWNGEPVPDGQRAEFSLDVRVTGTVGQTFTFPTEQRCTSGASHAWNDTEPSSTHPAPSFVATAASLTPLPSHTSPAASPNPTAPLLAGIVLASAGVGTLGTWATRRHRRAASK